MFSLRHGETESYRFKHFIADQLLFSQDSLCLAYFQGNKYFGYGSTGFLFASKYEQRWRIGPSKSSIFLTKQEADLELAKLKMEDSNNKSVVVMEYRHTDIWAKPQFQFQQVVNLETEGVKHLEYGFKLSPPVDSSADISQLIEYLKQHSVTVHVDEDLESSDPDHWKKHTDCML
jgi:hypothetical protein